MEKHNVWGLFVQSEAIIKRFRDLLNDKDCTNAFGGMYVVKLFNIAEDIGKVHDYIIDGKEGADRLYGEMLNLRSLTIKLKDEAFQKGFVPFADNCNYIISIIDDMERWVSNNPIPETGENGCLNTGNNSVENKSVESLTTDQIKAKINKIEPFLKAKANDNIPYGVYYNRLTKGEVKQADGNKKVFHVIDDEKCNFDLFCLCVERADISDIIKEGNISIARLFMYYVANRFKDSGEYKKAAEKAFGLQVRLSAVPSNYRADFHKLLGEEFPESEPK